MDTYGPSGFDQKVYVAALSLARSHDTASTLLDEFLELHQSTHTLHRLHPSESGFPSRHQTQLLQTSTTSHSANRYHVEAHRAVVHRRHHRKTYRKCPRSLQRRQIHRLGWDLYRHDQIDHNALSSPNRSEYHRHPQLPY